MCVELVATMTLRTRGIGYDGEVPWTPLPPDMQHFDRLTTGCHAQGKRNVVIMSRLTWDSRTIINHGLLCNRVTVVMSALNDVRLCPALPNLKDYPTDSLLPSVLSVSTWRVSDVLDALHPFHEQIGTVFVIGRYGATYRQCIEDDLVSKVHATEILQDFECDTFFPVLDSSRFYKSNGSDVMSFGDISFQFTTYSRMM